MNCFICSRRKVAVARYWIICLVLLRNRHILTNLTGSKNSTSSTTFLSFGLVFQIDVRPGLWFWQWHFRILTKLDMNKISTSSAKCLIYKPIGQRRWPSCFLWEAQPFSTPLDLWLLNWFWRNLTWRCQSSSTRICVFRTDPSTKMTPWSLIDR